ncbi:hypothetical protein HU230_0000775 [Bradyrhizobium quebecense]|uniref:Uncharacterized protein n=1 Tax=Bradyrhizobium quebecense TaxID=2748629 RepID=A0A974AIU7_9BRAD|nr:hypothetical protein [Bradyrhizobium quebecense]UGA44605.1 hypothetical protein HU230_0000775 [Bradyrhizobium quebecense]
MMDATNSRMVAFRRRACDDNGVNDPVHLALDRRSSRAHLVIVSFLRRSPLRASKVETVNRMGLTTMTVRKKSSVRAESKPPSRGLRIGPGNDDRGRLRGKAASFLSIDLRQTEASPSPLDRFVGKPGDAI